MADFPYNPVPEVMPSGRIPGQSIQTNPDMFGGATSRAMQKLGQTGADVAQREFDTAIKYQEMHNDTVVLQAKIEASKELAAIEDDFSQLNGLNAGAALPEYRKKVQAVHTKYAAQMTNPYMQESFTRNFEPMVAGTDMALGHHTAGQAEAAHESAMLGDIDAAKSRAVQHSGIMNVTPDFTDIVSQSLAYAHFKGLDKSAADVLVQDNIGGTVEDIIRARIAAGHTDQAAQILHTALDEHIPGNPDLPMLDGKYQSGLFALVTGQQEREQKERESAYKAAMAEVRERQSSDLEIRVNAGEATIAEVENAFNKNIISGSARASWITKISKEKDYRPTVLNALSGATILDPRDTQTRNAVDTYFDKDVLPALSGAQPDDVKSAITSYVERTGIVPSSLAGNIRGSLRAGTPQQKAVAADFIDRISDRVPQAVGDFSAADIATGKQIAGLVHDGVPVDQAVTHAETMAKTDPGVIKIRQDAMAAQQGAMPTDAVKHITRNVIGLTGWDAYTPLGFFTSGTATTDAAQAEFRRDFENAYLLTGDENAATAAAAAIAKRSWGVSTVNGNREVMKYAPEIIYGVLDHGEEDAKWIREQFIGEVTSHKAEVADAYEQSGVVVPPSDLADKAVLVSDTRTGRDLSYAVMMKDDNGAYEPVTGPTGNLLRFKPDFKTSKKAKEVIVEDANAASAVEKAKIGAVTKAKRERAALTSAIEEENKLKAKGKTTYDNLVPSL